MKQYRSLVRVTLGNSFKTFRNSVSKKSNTAVVFLLIAFLVLVFCVMFASTGAGLGPIAAYYAIESQIFTLALTVFSLLLLFFAIVYIFSLMYYSRDNEFLLSLPVKNSTIFLSKITVIYVLLEVIGGVMLIPFGIAYGVSAGLGAGFYFGLILAQIILPLCPIFLAVLLSFPLMYVISFIRKSRILSMFMVILGIVLFAGVYVGIFLIGVSMGSGSAEGGLVQLADHVVAMMRDLAGGIVFYDAVSQMFIAGTNVLASLGIFLACNSAFAGISILLSKVLYRRGMSKQLEASSEVIKVSKTKQYKTSSPMKAMLKKDLKFMIRTPIILFNLLIELVLPVLLIVIMSISLRPMMNEFDPSTMETVKYVMVVFCTLFGLTFACSLNFMAISTVSREGQSFYIMKMIPVPIYKQLEARANFAFLFPLFSIVLLSAVAFGMGLMEIQTAIMYLIFTSILAYGFTYYQVGLDVKRPKLDWDNITQITHNNINTMKCMGVSFLINFGFSALFIGCLILIGIFAGFLVAELITWAILIVIAILITFAFKRNFTKHVLYDFERIEA